MLDASGRYTNGWYPTSKRGRFSAGTTVMSPKVLTRDTFL